MIDSRKLSDVLRAIDDAIRDAPVSDDTSASEKFILFDRVDLLEHLGVYVAPFRERATGRKSSAPDGLGIIEDTIRVRLRYQLRGREGQKEAIRRVADYAEVLRRLVTNADPAARVRFDRNDYVFENAQHAYITLDQFYLSGRTGFVGRC